MSCGCGKKRAETAAIMEREASQLLPPSEWGPILWKYLHCLGERIGFSGNKIVDTDQANYMETFINLMPLILPCTECQAHSATYLKNSPLPALKGLYGADLRATLRQWLFLFHNEVRASKGQRILVETLEDYEVLYAGCSVQKCEYTVFVQTVVAAVRAGWVRIENWKKWYSNSERLRILTGNVIM
jgi:hypothetical protein